MADMPDSMLTDAERGELLRIARSSVECALTKRPLPEPEQVGPGLDMRAGAFVTLKGPLDALRGCIGTFERDGPLKKVVPRVARLAAFSDGRFRPVSAEELPELRFEISVLSPLSSLVDPLSFELGRHGVWVVGSGGECGTFLPQVARETGWSKEEFLSNCCSSKAGIRPDAWRDSSCCTVYVYTSEAFSE